jgi:hypothetical protein
MPITIGFFLVAFFIGSAALPATIGFFLVAFFTESATLPTELFAAAWGPDKALVRWRYVCLGPQQATPSVELCVLHRTDEMVAEEQVLNLPLVVVVGST